MKQKQIASKNAAIRTIRKVALAWTPDRLSRRLAEVTELTREKLKK